MKLDFYNCPVPEKMDAGRLPDPPAFLTYEPDFDLLASVARDYAQYKNIVIIAHGGSLTSFYGFYEALAHPPAKRAYFLSTVDPDYISEIKNTVRPQDTLVIAISKSGETVTQLEALSQFSEYPLLVITGKSSSLRAYGEKLEAAGGTVSMVIHPPIGGRYTGFTEVALVPAALVGVDVRALMAGAKKTYARYRTDNAAWEAASVLWQLEQQGYVDVFMPFYSHRLFPLSNLIVQLCHESFGKAGRGQTYFAHEAPESQHHTNQRFFGGPKNICGFFTVVEKMFSPSRTTFPSPVSEVWIKNKQLRDLHDIPLAASLRFEAEATLEDARIHGIPTVRLAVDQVSAEEVGELAAFWQLYAVYASVLRGVDPFDQPQVENSKNISFSKRLAYKGTL